MDNIQNGVKNRRTVPINNDGDKLIEKHLENDNNHLIKILADNIMSIKKLSTNIKTTLKDEESLRNDLENGFDKSESMMGSTMDKLNKLMNSDSGNVM